MIRFNLPGRNELGYVNDMVLIRRHLVSVTRLLPIKSFYEIY
jgi:hypothetical protein